MCFFFYGTLLDPDVRRAVLGPVAADLSPQAARLPEWHRVRLAGRDYPVIVPRVGKAVDGCVMRGLPASAASRLCRFEGPEYRLARLEVKTDGGDALCVRAFIGSGRTAPTTVRWDLEDWRRRHKNAFLRRLRAA